MTMVALFVTNREPPVKPAQPDKGGGIITGDGPSAGLLVGAAGPAADGSTRAAAIAGAMLGVLAAAVSLVWALYKFKPGLIAAGVGASTGGSAAAAAVDQTQGNQETSLLMPMTVQNGTAEPGGASDAKSGNVQTTDVDLANYFAPMASTMTRGVQADLDTGDGAGAGWTVSSALASRSSVEEVTKSRSGGLGGGGGSGTGTMNSGTQTVNLQTGMAGPGGTAGTAVYSTNLQTDMARQRAANVQTGMAGQGATTGTAVYSTYSYESRTISDSTRDASQIPVRQSAACRLNKKLIRR